MTDVEKSGDSSHDITGVEKSGDSAHEVEGTSCDSEVDPSLASDERYAYLQKGFTTEIYKIEICNLPPFLGYQVPATTSSPTHFPNELMFTLSVANQEKVEGTGLEASQDKDAIQDILLCDLQI